jgi:hypothetical protein
MCGNTTIDECYICVVRFALKTTARPCRYPQHVFTSQQISAQDSSAVILVSYPSFPGLSEHHQSCGWGPIYPRDMKWLTTPYSAQKKKVRCDNRITKTQKFKQVMFLSLRHRSPDVTVSLSSITMLLGERAVKTAQPRATDVTQWLWYRKICCYTYAPHARTYGRKHTHTHKICSLELSSVIVKRGLLTLRRNIISIQASANSMT